MSASTGQNTWAAGRHDGEDDGAMAAAPVRPGGPKSRGNWRMGWCSRTWCWGRGRECGKCVRFSGYKERKNG